MAGPRIVSLIASATEIVCALGFEDQLVGRSHECDFPASVGRLPVCTAPKVNVDGSSNEIDERVKAVLKQGLSVYRVHADTLKRLRPDVIVTQTQCEVCAVSLRDVEQAVCQWLGSRPQIVSLAPDALADVWKDIALVAQALGVPARGEELNRRLQDRMRVIADRASSLHKRPTVACVEWIAPLMAAGNWMPELVAMAGGVDVFGTAGKHAPRMTWEQLRETDPEVIVVMPCGFDIARSRRDMAALTQRPGWRDLRAVRERRVYLADGNQYLNRPGPRLVESLEILAELLHPAMFHFGHEGPGWQHLCAEQEVGRPAPGQGVEVSPALWGELLDPAAWQEGLEKYALAMHLAVVLVHADGRLLGPCLNPRPLWELLRARQPAGAGECPFALAPLRPCTCVADALKKRAVVRAQDGSGLAHFAVPLVLGEQRLGALVAGQVFGHDPEQQPLEQLAQNLGLSAAKVWEQARLEHPVSAAMLKVYEDLLTTLGQAFLQCRYHTLLEDSRRAERQRAEEALRRARDELEKRVEERTAALEEAQKKTLQAERLAAIGEMVAGLAHEGRNALQRSQACLEMLCLRLQGQPEALSLLGRVQKAQDDLHRLYDEVRGYAAPMHLEPRACNLAEVWREAWADLGAAREGRQAELREETAGTNLECVVSRFHLKQVFRNLLHNALTAGADPVEIVIRCWQVEIGGDPAIRVAVRDNGPGFAAGQKQGAFEPFYTTKVRGTGLGLPICKRIVEAHGGRIDVDEGPGPGAQVVITLPRRGA